MYKLPLTIRQHYTSKKKNKTSYLKCDTCDMSFSFDTALTAQDMNYLREHTRRHQEGWRLFFVDGQVIQAANLRHAKVIAKRA